MSYSATAGESRASAKAGPIGKGGSAGPPDRTDGRPAIGSDRKRWIPYIAGALVLLLLFRSPFHHVLNIGSPDAGKLDQDSGFKQSTDSSMSLPQVPSPNGKVTVAYFVNWAIYGRKHFPWNVPMSSLTHILYSFANVRPESGEVYLTDGWADEQIHWTDRGDSWNDPGNNMYGCFNQFRKLKQQHRHVKLLLSIGGWTYSPNFAGAAETGAKRQAFADSCRKLVEDYGLDGVDIDWEYPMNDEEARHFVDLLRKTRHALDDLAASKGERNGYLLTIAAPCGEQHFSKLRVKEMDEYLSFWNLMAYDYAGSWDTLAGHQANLHSSSFTNQGHFSTASALAYYRRWISADKLVIGMPLYGRSFASSSGIGEPFSGVGQGSWEAGVYDYKALPVSGPTVHEDLRLGASWVYDESKRELTSYDTPKVAEVKARFIKDQGLGGAMWWETSGDRTDTSGSLIHIVANQIGKLDTTPNHLYFPQSKWDNLKDQATGVDAADTAGGSNDGPPPVPTASRPSGNYHRSPLQKIEGAFH